jgi:Carboxypeptidase regulatory-like domain
VGNLHRPHLRAYVTFCLALAITLLGIGTEYATAQTEKASVSGRVTDQTNAALADADVQIKNTDTGVVTAVKTNAEGVYAVPSLNPGNYMMTVNKPGFRTVSLTGMTLNVQENLSRNFTLQIGSAVESVTVEAESGADLIQTTSSNLGTVINQKAIHELPLNGRSFSQLLTLTPGATPISTSQSQGVGVNDLANLGVPTASVAQPAIQGQFNRSNLYFLDGVINTELTSSAFIVPPIIDAMQEFKVQSHDDQAEYGSVLGGVVNIVTRSGTNQLHGSLAP